MNPPRGEALRGAQVDRHDAYATPVCTSAHSRDQAGLSRALQSFRVQTDEHFLTVTRCGEGNVLRVKLVNRAEAWQRLSLWRWIEDDSKLTAWLSAWPVARPRDWIARENRPETVSELEALRLSVQRGWPFGEDT